MVKSLFLFLFLGVKIGTDPIKYGQLAGKVCKMH